MFKPFFTTCVVCFLLVCSIFADDYKKEILGSWYSVDDPLTRIEFLESGKVNFYKEDEFYLSEDYFVTAECNGDTISYMDWKYLKTIDAGGEISCLEIQGIDLFGNGELWLMDRETDQLIKYSRNKSE
jgi:hypothetical protein